MLNSALKSGTFEAAVKNGEDNEELNITFTLITVTLLLFSAKDGEEELANAGFYFKDKVITVEPGEDEEVSAFKISLTQSRISSANFRESPGRMHFLRCLCWMNPN